MNIETCLINGKDYCLVEKINYNNNIYYFLVNTDDNKDLIIRKLTKENNEDYLIGLDNEQEFYEIMFVYNNKQK